MLLPFNAETVAKILSQFRQNWSPNWRWRRKNLADIGFNVDKHTMTNENMLAQKIIWVEIVIEKLSVDKDDGQDRKNHLHSASDTFYFTLV